jgi:putative SOS response-associated peptidase YedK
MRRAHASWRSRMAASDVLSPMPSACVLNPELRMAEARAPVRRALHFVLRVRRSKTAQDADLVRVRRESTAAVFAGIWTTWRGVRGPKSKPVDGEHELFDFLTTEANDVVAPIHPKAMPAILTTPDEIELWMTAPAEPALKLQRPLPDGTLRIVATGEKEDGAVAPV